MFEFELCWRQSDKSILYFDLPISLSINFNHTEYLRKSVEDIQIYSRIIPPKKLERLIKINYLCIDLNLPRWCYLCWLPYDRMRKTNSKYHINI